MKGREKEIEVYWKKKKNREEKTVENDWKRKKEWIYELKMS